MFDFKCKAIHCIPQYNQETVNYATSDPNFDLDFGVGAIQKAKT